MDILSDPLYGLLMAIALTALGGFLAFVAENKFGWVLLIAGLYWVWFVLGQQEWGIPGPPFP
jgi:hypothetical protein